jgi:hypothetical protein
MVQGKIDGLEMPPATAGGRLSDSHLQDLARWIREGAADPRTSERVVTPIEIAARSHWAFQPLSPPEVPADQHPIDFLVRNRLTAAGMQVVEPAETTVPIRRAALDLTGLPPTSDQLATTREQFPELVRSLLASPHYAEPLAATLAGCGPLFRRTRRRADVR